MRPVRTQLNNGISASVRGIKTDEKDLCCTVARHKHTRGGGGGGGAVSGEEVTKVFSLFFFPFGVAVAFYTFHAAPGGKRQQE